MKNYLPCFSVATRINDDAALKNIILIFIASLVLALSAYTSIPFYPAAITMQTFSVLLIGALLGSNSALIATGMLFMYGIAGFPVFANGASFYGLSTSLGYVLGFIPAAYLSGLIHDTKWAQNLFAATLILMAALFTIYLCGALWLSTYIGYQNAIILGVLPFLAGDAIKLSAVLLLTKKLWQK